ncbi:MAG: 3-keto-disaccharide hydrolase [Ramlibacter sp.]
MKNVKRTISLVLAAAALALAGCASMRGGGGTGGEWQTLIDGGRGMDNFVNMGGANWRSEGDAIVADSRPGKEPTYYLATKNSYKDFRLHAEFWVSDDANSGLYLRCSDVRPMTDRTCHEANIFDQRPDPSYATGAIVWLVKAPVPVPKTGGRWNTMDITARGKHLEVVLNGVKTAETDEARDNGGVIGLQYAGGVVKFRKLQVQPL